MSDFCPHCKKLLKPGLETHLGLCRTCREAQTAKEVSNAATK